MKVHRTAVGTTGLASFRVLCLVVIGFRGEGAATFILMQSVKSVQQVSQEFSGIMEKMKGQGFPNVFGGVTFFNIQ